MELGTVDRKGTNQDKTRSILLPLRRPSHSFLLLPGEKHAPSQQNMHLSAGRLHPSTALPPCKEPRLPGEISVLLHPHAAPRHRHRRLSAATVLNGSAALLQRLFIACCVPVPDQNSIAPQHLPVLRFSAEQSLMRIQVRRRNSHSTAKGTVSNKGTELLPLPGSI